MWHCGEAVVEIMSRIRRSACARACCMRRRMPLLLPPAPACHLYVNDGGHISEKLQLWSVAVVQRASPLSRLCAAGIIVRYVVCILSYPTPTTDTHVPAQGKCTQRRSSDTTTSSPTSEITSSTSEQQLSQLDQ